MKIDIRTWQILVLGALLFYGVTFEQFDVSVWQVAFTFFAAIGSQALITRFIGGKANSVLSASITSLGICILLRSATYWVHPLVACLAISSKYLIKYHGQHFVNPANLAVLTGTLLPASWISSGQWGDGVHIWFLVSSLGVMGITRAGSYCSTLAFLLSYSSIWTIHRVLYLGYEWNDLLHHLGNGALLLFAFFMISDPRTTPRPVWGKCAHGVCVASMAYVLSYEVYFTQGVLWSLLFSSLLVPVINSLTNYPEFLWEYASFRIPLSRKSNNYNL